MSCTKNINPSQFSAADLQKITDYIAILVSIDRKKSVPNKGEHHEK